MKELNSERIMREIQEYIKAGIPYIDAVIEYAEKNEVEIEVVGEIIRRSPVLKAKIHDEAEELNMIERQAKLPI
jgi:predicted aldo/keto reductase-like oxidoreductase